MSYQNREERQNQKLCRDCPLTTDNDQVLCQKCRSANLQRAKEHEYNKIYRYPDAHRKSQYARKQRLMADGLCKHCADVRITYESECDRCHNKRMAARGRKGK